MNTLRNMSMTAVMGLAASAPAQCPPAAPTGLTASQGTYCGSVYVDWIDVSGATSYTVYRNTTNNYSTSSLAGAALFGASHLTDVAVVAGTRYYYWVVATHSPCFPGTGTGNPSAVAQGWKGNDPAAPTSVSASDGTQVCYGIRVTWGQPAAPLGGNVTGYTIFRSPVNLYASSTEVGTAGPQDRSFFDASAPGAQYCYYWVRAESTCGSAVSESDYGSRLDPQVPNLQCQDALVVAAGQSYEGRTPCNAGEGPDTCGTGTAAPAAWYRFNATSSGTLHADTCGSTGAWTFDTVLSVFNTCPQSGASLVGCNDNACGVFSAVDVPVAAGTSYYIRVAGRDGDTGFFELNVDFTAAGCYANCDGSSLAPILNVQDFSCFLNKFAAGNTYANCDGSSTAPVLNVQDFSCFLNRFAAGCS